MTRARLLLAGLAVGAVLVAVVALWWSSRPAHTFVLVSVGDINLAEDVTKRLRKHGGDYMYENVREYLHGDFLMGNLESVVTETPRDDLFDDKPSIHEMEPRYLQPLKDEGFGLLVLANNHAMDQGPDGLGQMLDHLDAAGFGRAGAGRTEEEARAPWIIEGEGIRIGVLSFAWPHKHLREWGWFAGVDRPGVAGFDDEAFAEDVRRLKEQVDFVIASVHWGNYYSREGKRTRARVKRIVAAGVDLVNGHGAHIAGGVGLVDGVPVVYDLGNFTFGSWGNYERRSPEDRTSAVARYVFNGEELDRIEFMPILTDNMIVKFKPRRVTAERAEREFEPDLDRYGLPWELRDDGWYVVSLPRRR
jgi:cyanophycin synthetase